MTTSHSSAATRETSRSSAFPAAVESSTPLMAMPAAKGLFHRAIIESGSLLRAHDQETATQIAKVVLSRLGLAENQVDELQSIPADKLYEAAEASGSKA